MSHPLDDPVRGSLTGAHAHLAQRRGNILRYPPEVSPFAWVPRAPGPDDWADVAALVGPGGSAGMIGNSVPTPPQGWGFWQGEGVQMVDDRLDARDDDEAVRLGPADVPEMLELVARTEPGPFRERTLELGTYLGIRRDGALVAMAGERLQPPGWTEISAVCTDPAFRGQGLATRLVRAIAAGVRRRGDTPFLHAAGTNTNAIRLYESLGFQLRRTISFGAATAAE